MAGYKFINPRYRNVGDDSNKVVNVNSDLACLDQPQTVVTVPTIQEYGHHGHGARSATFPHGYIKFGYDLRPSRRRSIGVLPSASVFGMTSQDSGGTGGGRLSPRRQSRRHSHVNIAESTSMTMHFLKRLVSLFCILFKSICL